MKNFDVCKETQKERTKTLAGLISGVAYIWGTYIQNNIFVGK